jgi:hypothetical protein
MSDRKGIEYKDGELEVILALSPTDLNIKNLSNLLDRTPDAIKLVYRIAFEHGPFAKEATSQENKILAAKKKLGISIGRKKARKKVSP